MRLLDQSSQRLARGKTAAGRSVYTSGIIPGSALARPSVDSEAVNVRMERPQLTRLDDWRRGQVEMPTRPEAIRRLIELGLEAAAREKEAPQ
jgi:hypothetical protein